MLKTQQNIKAVWRLYNFSIVANMIWLCQQKLPTKADPEEGKRTVYCSTFSEPFTSSSSLSNEWSIKV